MEVISKFKAHFHSFYDVLLFIRIFLFITALPFLIRFLSLPQLMKVLTWHILCFSENRVKEAYTESVVRFADYILKRNFWLYRNTCFKRSLVLYHFLHNAHSDIRICFGVRLKKNTPVQEREKGLEGHAWLMNNGEIIPDGNSDPTSTYTVTYCFPERYSDPEIHD